MRASTQNASLVKQANQSVSLSKVVYTLDKTDEAFCFPELDAMAMYLHRLVWAALNVTFSRLVPVLMTCALIKPVSERDYNTVASQQIQQHGCHWTACIYSAIACWNSCCCKSALYSHVLDFCVHGLKLHWHGNYSFMPHIAGFAAESDTPLCADSVTTTWINLCCKPWLVLHADTTWICSLVYGSYWRFGQLWCGIAQWPVKPGSLHIKIKWWYAFWLHCCNMPVLLFLFKAGNFHQRVTLLP